MKFLLNIDSRYSSRAYPVSNRGLGYSKINVAIKDMKYQSELLKAGQSIVCVNDGKSTTMMLMQFQAGEYNGMHKVKSCLKISELIFIKKSFVRKTNIQRGKPKPKRKLKPMPVQTDEWIWIDKVDAAGITNAQGLVFYLNRKKKARRKKWPKKTIKRTRPS